MDETRATRISKFLSKHLRHDPAGLGLQLEVGGWVRIDDLLHACQQKRFPVTWEELEEVVLTNNKQRFSFDSAEEKIRANQGHSVEVDLQLVATSPPDNLYHGTGEKSVPLLLTEGLKRMKRHHVHLSTDLETAIKVGRRHGKPVVLIVDSKKMADDGHSFYLSTNGVWLTDQVPPTYLKVLQEPVQ